MACPVVYPNCPNPVTAFFPLGIPSISIVSECCSETGTIQIQITGVNNTDLTGGGFGYLLSIDGSMSGPDGNYCVSSPDPASPPCLTTVSPNLTVLNYTTGPIAVGDPFQVTVEYTYPACGECDIEDGFLNLFMTGKFAANQTDICCQVAIPVNINVGDQAPFTISTVGLNMNACVGQCDTDQFFITNTGCQTREFSIVPTCASAGMILPNTTVTLGPGDSSPLYPVQYCPTIVENGACFITITSIDTGVEPPVDPCVSEQSLPIAYNGFQTYDCIDGVCTINATCSGMFNSLAACQAGCVTPAPTATLCLDCNFISINDVAITDTCGKTCANVGQEVCINKNIGFPIRIFTILGADNVLNTFQIEGNWAGFNENVQFDVTDSTCNDGTYTIVSSSYDATTNLTTIVVSEPVPCNTIDGDITIIQDEDSECPQIVHLNIINSVTGEVIIDQDFIPVNNWVFLNYCFTLLTFGDYVVTLTAGDCFESFTCQYTIAACQQYTIEKTECHQYLVTDNAAAAPGKIDTVFISNLDGSYTQSYTIDFSTGTSVLITLPEDGVYTVTITDNLTNNVFQDVIYDLCDLLVCTRKLILDIFCNEKDPCCKECDEQRKREQEIQRADMNKLIALTGTLFAYINRQKISYMGIFTIDDCRNLDLQMIMDIFVKINEITDRCGECKKKTPVTSSSPCKSC